MEALFQFIEGELEAGQSALADASRRMLYQRAPEWLELLDFENDAVFLDALLFAFLTNPDPTSDFPLAQLLWGRTPVERRPRTLNVVSDAGGVVWLSGVGTFSTGQPRRVFQLREGERIELHDEDGPISSCALEAPWMLCGENVHLLARPHPVLDRLFVDESGAGADYEISDIAPAARQPLERALATLKQTVPRIHAALVAVLNTVVVFHSARINSFSNPAAHGAAFLNAADPATEPSFIEDLPHQAGHVLFSALTFEVSTYLTVPRAALLRDFTGTPGDERTVYAVLHGIFTEALMTLTLDACLRHGPDDQSHEVGGRLGFILRRFGTDLSSLSRPGIFSERGEMLFASIGEVLRATLQTRGAMADAMDFSNQLYNFDYQRFAALNPS